MQLNLVDGWDDLGILNSSFKVFFHEVADTDAPKTVRSVSTLR